MNTLQQQYSQLLNELKQHITEEYTAGSWIRSEPEIYDYFKNFALQRVSQKKNQAMNTPAAAPTHLTMGRQQIDKLPSPMTPLADRRTIQAQVTLKQEVNTDFQSSPVEIKTINGTAEQPPNVIIEARAITAPVITRSKESHPKPKAFQREAFAIATEGDFFDIKQFFTKKFPQALLHSAPPKDDAAKAYISQWKAPVSEPKVVILTFGDNPQEKIFLSNLKYAINLELADAVLYAAEKYEMQENWPAFLANKQLKLIIAHKGRMESMPMLMQHYREDPQPALGKARIYPLCDIMHYIQQPNLKCELWNALASILQRS